MDIILEINLVNNFFDRLGNMLLQNENVPFTRDTLYLHNGNIWKLQQVVCNNNINKHTESIAKAIQ